MRLLGGPHRRVLLAGYGLLGSACWRLWRPRSCTSSPERTSVRGSIGTNGAYGALPCHFYHPFTGSYQNLHSLNWGAKQQGCPSRCATGGMISMG